MCQRVFDAMLATTRSAYRLRPASTVCFARQPKQFRMRADNRPVRAAQTLPRHAEPCRYRSFHHPLRDFIPIRHCHNTVMHVPLACNASIRSSVEEGGWSDMPCHPPARLPSRRVIWAARSILRPPCDCSRRGRHCVMCESPRSLCQSRNWRNSASFCTFIKLPPWRDRNATKSACSLPPAMPASA